MNDLGRMIKQQRLVVPLTLRQLSATSGISVSHLSRIEQGDRLPSARTLGRIARPLGFEKNELFTLAGFLSSTPSDNGKEESEHTISRLDPYVVKVLAKEPVTVQRHVISLLIILKSLAEKVK